MRSDFKAAYEVDDLKRITKKAVSFLVTLTMLITIILNMTALPVSADAQVAVTADTGWYSSEISEFTLTDAADLAGLAELVNGGIDFAGKKVMLGNDIDLSVVSGWTPIGTVFFSSTGSPSGGMAFAGTFDGCGYSITGLSCSMESGGAGLFGYCTGTLKDFILEGKVAGDACTAGVAALGSGTFENIINKAAVTSAENYVGGIIADASGDIIIKNCHNKAVITNGGVASEKSTGRIAGIVGRIDTGKNAEITNCSNTADITGYQYVGGIIGGSFGNVDIQSCFNSGDITGISFGMVHLGGIAGELVGGTIDSCYNIGVVRNRPWSSGHIRGVGGIAGDEQGRTDGSKAITNSYNAGIIDLDTSKMEGKNIYMTGNISGGNKKTDPNTMVYENCFYLENTLHVGNPDYWVEIYKNDNTVYDTKYITKCTESELKSESVLNALGSKFKSDGSGGYPVLKWQDGSTETPDTQKYAIKYSISGGTAHADSAVSSEKGKTVDFTVSDIESGKQIKRVTAADAAGNVIDVMADTASGGYTFVMPGRDVTVYIVLENKVKSDAASYKVTLPVVSYDPIWNISIDSGYYDESTGTVKEGASVTLVVDKAQGAANTSFEGLTITNDFGSEFTAEAANIKGKADSLYHGEYTFTMPSCDIKIALKVKFAELTVQQTIGSSTSLVKTYSRNDMLQLAGTRERAYVSGWSTETIPFVAAAEKYVKLSELLKDAGVTFEKGDKLQLRAEDGFVQTFTYESLFETERSYYADILKNGKNASQKTAVEPILTVTANTTSDTDADITSIICDTLNTYRLYFGQSESELKNAVKIVDSLPKNIVDITVIKPSSSSGGGGGNSSGSSSGSSSSAPVQTAVPQDTSSESGYSDIAADSWYSDAVKYVTDKKLMDGTGRGRFSPDACMTRGMIMTILARMSGTDTAGSSPWYKKGLEWAVSKNISDGTKPESAMTREQLVTMLYRYSAVMGKDMSQGGMSVREYDDFNKISSYASEAMMWAVNNQIITGVTKSELQPQGTATRAQTATILMRWISSF